MNLEADALFTRTQQRVLGLLFGKPDMRFHANEIVRLAGMGRGTVRRELERLVAASVVTLVREGNQHHYQANPDCPIYAELVGIVRKTFGLGDVLRQSLAPLGDKVQMAFIYGSVAKGGDTRESDIDLMLIGEGLVYGEVLELLQPLEVEVGRTINPTIYSVIDFRSKLDTGQGFLGRVMDGPRIMIKDDMDEPGESGKEQAAEGRTI